MQIMISIQVVGSQPIVPSVSVDWIKVKVKPEKSDVKHCTVQAVLDFQFHGLIIML